MHSPENEVGLPVLVVLMVGAMILLDEIQLSVLWNLFLSERW
jgi:hypothetical protein